MPMSSTKRTRKLGRVVDGAQADAATASVAAIAAELASVNRLAVKGEVGHDDEVLRRLRILLAAPTL